MGIMKKTYTRKILFKTKDVEVVLITWPPGSRTPFHDHGKSHGLVRILKGEIAEEVFDKKTRKFLRRVVYKKEGACFESPDIIHRMLSASKTKIAESIHIYTPRLKMKNYDRLERSKK